ncbi:initiator tRNA phosphoribosyl transferase [Schizopora paradoxa]|uniref:Initiator tRNA phosphoribosyl transferase n=1 Tax=Schizopora paradoxa TaxID=27342 RepID=A0A0H2RH38_9AGAM|nr:initiator tRNA phosphoribosyl transferase [Schizopora paradoxa]
MDHTYDLRTFEHQAREEIRKLSNDLYNRLHSITEDAKFVGKVKDIYHQLPVVENLRCGSWYVDPTIKSRVSAYFKSADGHYNAWTYNLRRPNIQLLPVIVEHSGCANSSKHAVFYVNNLPPLFSVILVDSTRSGKRIPDALSKTVPIWCAVVNRALQLRKIVNLALWDTNLYTPPDAVSKQEHWQIEARLDGWAHALAASSYELPPLSKPLRPVWITPATKEFPTFNNTNTDFHPIICLSVSKVVQDGLQRREAGYSYVQGAGDDHESWSLGLTPSLFWECRDEILKVPQDEMDDFVRELVRHRANLRSDGSQMMLPTPIERVGGRIALSSNSELPADVFSETRLAPEETDNDYCYLLMNSGLAEEPRDQPQQSIGRSAFVAYIQIDMEKKVGDKSLAGQLPVALQFIQRCLSGGRRVCVSCDAENSDLSAVVAMAALQSFFDDDGRLISGEIAIKPAVNKPTLRTRLQWIIASQPKANPSRTALKRLNEFYMSPR